MFDTMQMRARARAARRRARVLAAPSATAPASAVALQDGAGATDLAGVTTTPTTDARRRPSPGGRRAEGHQIAGARVGPGRRPAAAVVAPAAVAVAVRPGSPGPGPGAGEVPTADFVRDPRSGADRARADRSGDGSTKEDGP
jgi:hypothetical protein